jgi:hypothetical protein
MSFATVMLGAVAASAVQAQPLFRYSDGTFTRASEASYPTSATTIAWATTNVLRDAATMGDETVGAPLAATFLLENSSTNLALHSEDFTQAAWVLTNATIATPGTEVPPDGEDFAQALVGTTAGSLAKVEQGPLGAAGTRYAYSVWLKQRGSNTDACIEWNDGTSTDRQNVTLTSAWQRVTIGLMGSAAADTVTFRIYPHLNGSAGVLANDGDDCWVWGAQVEAVNISVAGSPRCLSSYIRTGAAAVTRAADSLTFTPGQIPNELRDGHFQVRVRFPFITNEANAVNYLIAASNNNTNGARVSSAETVQVLYVGVVRYASGASVVDTSVREAPNLIDLDQANAICTLNGVSAGAGTPVDWTSVETTWRVMGSNTTHWGRISEFYAA